MRSCRLFHTSQQWCYFCQLEGEGNHSPEDLWLSGCNALRAIEKSAGVTQERGFLKTPFLHFTCLSRHIHAHVCIHAHMNGYAYVYICMCIRVYVCMYVWGLPRLRDRTLIPVVPVLIPLGGVYPPNVRVRICMLLRVPPCCGDKGVNSI